MDRVLRTVSPSRADARCVLCAARSGGAVRLNASVVGSGGIRSHVCAACVRALAATDEAVLVDRAALASLLDRCETRWGPSAPMPSDGDPGAPGGACCNVCEGHREGDRDAAIPHDQECVVPGLRAALLAGRG